MKEFEVLPLLNRDANGEQDGVLAICLPLNLVGRGSGLGEAMMGLVRSIREFFNTEPGEVIEQDPDPRLLRAYENGSIREINEDRILQRTRLRFENSLLLRSVASSAKESSMPEALTITDQNLSVVDFEKLFRAHHCTVEITGEGRITLRRGAGAGPSHRHWNHLLQLLQAEKDTLDRWIVSSARRAMGFADMADQSFHAPLG